MRTKVLKCSDFGLDCPVEFRAPTVEGVIEQAQEHGMAVHGQTREQVASEEVMRIAAEKVREEDGS